MFYRGMLIGLPISIALWVILITATHLIFMVAIEITNGHV
jgi:hypothetical protein